MLAEINAPKTIRELFKATMHFDGLPIENQCVCLWDVPGYLKPVKPTHSPFFNALTNAALAADLLSLTQAKVNANPTPTPRFISPTLQLPLLPTKFRIASLPAPAFPVKFNSPVSNYTNQISPSLHAQIISSPAISFVAQLNHQSPPQQRYHSLVIQL